MSENKKRVFSGIKSSGEIHIGNYLGAIRNWVKMQDDYNNIFCVVDLHTVTIQQEPKILKRRIRELAGMLIACGIDPAKSTLFIQSHVHEHSELAWLLNCSIPIGWMQRMTQFKDKSAKNKESVSVGLFDYPALMAADILLYDSDAVPVGDDQKQHVELTRDAAQRFNSLYGKTFVVPEPIIPKIGARIMGLDDPLQKMSKSEDGRGQAIEMLEAPDSIVKKIKRATTDSLRTLVFDEKRPAIYNLMVIYELFSGKERSEIEEHFSTKGYGDFKKELAEVVVEGLRPIRERYNELTANPEELDKILADGVANAKPIASRTLARAKKRMGLD